MGLLDRLADLLGFGSEEPAACSGADAPPQARSVPEGGWASAMTSVVRDREEADRRAREEARLASDRNTSALLSDEEFIDWASREVLAQGLDFARASHEGQLLSLTQILCLVLVLADGAVLVWRQIQRRRMPPFPL